MRNVLDTKIEARAFIWVFQEIKVKICSFSKKNFFCQINFIRELKFRLKHQSIIRFTKNKSDITKCLFR